LKLSDLGTIIRKNPSQSAAIEDWRELYLTALFETDRQKLPSLVAEAERALVVRSRELFAKSGSNSAEARAVDKGLYALRALRDCLELKTVEPEAA
jgi:hypothetical protein